MITVKDIEKSEKFPFASKDKKKSLIVGAAVGTGGDSEERITLLVEAGVDVIVIDTAHGHSQGVLDRVAWTKKHFPDQVANHQKQTARQRPVSKMHPQ